ncbi:ABC transporter ATP-binding protein [Rhizobium sp. 2MFCol3.1]|uniref:ABC transporter ATP-binding protein n=1 Tax=Rhizobium sp. 2MFCol3.1 TaxID=1246459 RepID=UPI00037D144E|nr:ABC transporter ATP-binding protein [Rhizobium sp. 2MFCol3.1]
MQKQQRQVGVQEILEVEPEVIVSVRDFSLTFSENASQNLIDGVSFDVEAGKMLCIVGESGCGKSVMSLALMGLLTNTKARVVSGSMRLGDDDLLAMSERRRADLRGSDMAMIFQEPMTSLNPAFTIGHQIIEGIRRHRSITKQDATVEALELLKKVGLPAEIERLNRFPHQLSGGQRQRVMIAMALANNPRLLIADEPTTALDVTIQAQILTLMKSLQQSYGSAIVLITHDLRVVAEVADNVMVMYAGRAVEAGPVTSVFENPQHPYTIGLFGSTPTLGPKQGRLATIEGTVPKLEDMPQGCRFAPRCPFSDEKCFEQVPPDHDFGSGHRAACWHAPIDLLASAA